MRRSPKKRMLKFSRTFLGILVIALLVFTPLSQITPRAVGITSSTITVNAITANNEVLHQWATVTDSSNNIIAKGFTPATFSVTSGSQYTVHLLNFQNTIFNHWDDDGSTDSSRTITPTQDTTYNAIYNKGDRITLEDLGVLQLVSHDLYNTNRQTVVDNEDVKLNLSTVLDYGQENIANGGEPRNSENILVHTVAVQLGETYLQFLSQGKTPEEARDLTVQIYLAKVKSSYSNTFNEAFPQADPNAEDESSTLTGDLALRTVHSFLPGQIMVNGKSVPVLDPSLHGKTLSDADMKQLSKPLDGTYDPAFRHIIIFVPPNNLFTIDLLQKDSSFAQQFHTDFTLEHFLDELRDGKYDATDDIMKVIRDDIATAQTPESSSGLTAAEISTTQVNLSWDLPDGTVSGYLIERSTDGGSNWSTIGYNDGSTDTTYSDTGLVPATQYTYRVTATNTAGASNPSDTAIATTSTSPSSPLSVSINAPSTGTTGTLVNLGSAPTGGQPPYTYSWSLASVPSGSAAALSSITDPSPTFTPDIAGDYVVGVTVTDSASSPHTANSQVATITVTALPPLSVSINAPSTGTTGTLVNLGSAPTGGQPPYTYSWSLASVPSGSAAALSSTTDPSPTFTPDIAGDYVVGVTVTDSASSPHTANSQVITITVTALPPTTVSLTLNSVELPSNPFAGQWIALSDSSGNTIATGFTPITFTVTTGTQYTVFAPNGHIHVFNHWDDGSTDSSRTITPTQDTTFTSYYTIGSATPPPPASVSVTVKSMELPSNPFTGQWIVVRDSSGSIIATGFTPITFTATTGSQYNIHAPDGHLHTFDYLDDGSTNSFRTITPTQDSTLVVYYRIS